ASRPRRCGRASPRSGVERLTGGQTSCLLPSLWERVRMWLTMMSPQAGSDQGSQYMTIDSGANPSSDPPATSNDPATSDRQGQMESTLPGAAYLSEEFFARERERIFLGEWMCVGREETIAAPG